MKNNPCFTLEHCLHDLRSRLLFLKRASLWSHLAHPSPTTRARACTHTHTHTHTSWLLNSPCHRGSIVRNGLCQSKECAFAFGEGCFPQPCSQDIAVWVLSLIVLRLPLCSSIIFPAFALCTLHLPWIPSNTWVMGFSPQLITYGVWEFHFFLNFVCFVVMFNICGQGIVNI